MRFRIIEEKFGKQTLIKLLNSDTQEYISILPEYGGMLNSMELLLGNKMISVLDDYNSESELIETLDSSFKGSNLFPFPNRIDEGKYTFNNQNHQLFVNFPDENNAIHGLVFNKKFQVTDKKESDNESGITLEYQPNEEIQGYPFKYLLKITYNFSAENGLTITSYIKNIDKQDIPIGHGWHPYVKLISNVDNIEFQFPGEKSYEVNSKMIPTGKFDVYNKYNELRKIDNDSFDTCFKLSENKSIAETIVIDPELQAGLSIWQETGRNKYNYLQVYTPPQRKTIAIEPMTCMPNALNNKNGIIILQPEKEIIIQWGIKKK